MTLQNSMLKKGKKGFTLTELAIVIAVIAILIAVLVPTFTSVITSARRTTAAETAKNALTEYNIETYTTVPDGSIVVYGDYYWTVANGSFEVSEDGDSSKVDKTDMVEYSWGSEVDSGISDVVIYVPATEMTSAVAKVLAKNYATNFSVSGLTDVVVTYVRVEYSTAKTTSASAVKLTSDSTNTKYYFYDASSGSISSTEIEADYEDDETYQGIVIGYASATKSADIAVAGMKTVSNLSAGTYYVKAITANNNVYYYAVTYTAATEEGGTGTYSATVLSDSTLYGTTAGTKADMSSTSYSDCIVYYKAQATAESEVKTAAQNAAKAAAEAADTEKADTYKYAVVTVGESTYYVSLTGSSGTYTASSGSFDALTDKTLSSTDTTTTSGYTVNLYVTTDNGDGDNSGTEDDDGE